MYWTKMLVLRRGRQVPGVLGLVLTIGALLAAPPAAQPWYFLIGAILMGVTAVLEWHVFFMGLEVIVLTGTALGCIAPARSTALLVLAVTMVAVLIWFWLRGLIHSSVDFFGYIAICCLSYGYAFVSTPAFFVSGILLSVYSYLDLRRGSSVAMLWLILNASFALAAGVTLWKLLF